MNSSTHEFETDLERHKEEVLEQLTQPRERSWVCLRPFYACKSFILFLWRKEEQLLKKHPITIGVLLVVISTSIAKSLD